jgi:hypothetical protein
MRQETPVMFDTSIFPAFVIESIKIRITRALRLYLINYGVPAAAGMAGS